jgi:cytochrome c biogenesis protein CcmG/thiol:disulfide interchange protein DsbE
MRRFLYVLPALAFGALVYVFFRSLSGPPPDELPSALIDRPAPTINLPPLDANAHGFGAKDLHDGHVTVVNFWASWCVPCRAEAPGLAALSGIKAVTLYGVVYKDTPAKARAFLADTGNPFSGIDVDSDGRAGIEWGIYGVPETFVIDGKGFVRLRYAGPLVGDTIENTILPAIRQAQAAR